MIAEWLVRLLTIYAAMGIAFGVLFVLAGVHRIDPAARGAGAGFRFMILPGVVALWPALLLRWLGGSS